jgi:hypothetical protein
MCLSSVCEVYIISNDMLTCRWAYFTSHKRKRQRPHLRSYHNAQMPRISAWEWLRKDYSITHQQTALSSVWTYNMLDHFSMHHLTHILSGACLPVCFCKAVQITRDKCIWLKISESAFTALVLSGFASVKGVNDSGNDKTVQK